MNVSHEELHRAARGDFPGFVQILLRALGAGARAGEKTKPGAGEEGTRDMIAVSGTAEAVYGLN